MEAIYLQSMTDFVLEQKKALKQAKFGMEKYYESMDKSIKYAEFLKQPLQLGFFVPCDLLGNVLEKPMYFDKWESGIRENVSWEGWKTECEIYQQAKERVLFKGFRLIANSNIPRIENGHCVIFLEDIAKMKIEDLLQKWDALELTENAIKQIGL